MGELNKTIKASERKGWESKFHIWNSMLSGYRFGWSHGSLSGQNLKMLVSFFESLTSKAKKSVFHSQ